MIGQKPMFYQSIKQRKIVFYCFFATLSLDLSTFLLEIVKNIFFEEICDGFLCETAESFEDEACSTLVVLDCVSLLISVLCCFYLCHVKSIS